MWITIEQQDSKRSNSSQINRQDRRSKVSITSQCGLLKASNEVQCTVWTKRHQPPPIQVGMRNQQSLYSNIVSNISCVNVTRKLHRNRE